MLSPTKRRKHASSGSNKSEESTSTATQSLTAMMVLNATDKKKKSNHKRGSTSMTAPTTTTTTTTPRRRSKRDTNRIVLNSGRNGSLPYRRMEQLFFDEPVTTAITRSKKQPKKQGQSPPVVTIRIAKLTLERAFTAPNIYVIDNFLTSSDLEYLHDKVIRQCHRKFQRSYVDSNVDATSLLDHTHRTSTFLSFAKQENAKIAAIEQRAAQLLGYYSTDQIEPLQLVRYLPGQFFGVHHDMGDLNEDSGQVALPPKNVLVKRRLVTIFCYLNDLPPQAGGCTYFPECQHLKIQPQQGRAVVFANVNPEGLPDPRTVHAGDPVLSISTTTTTHTSTTTAADGNGKDGSQKDVVGSSSQEAPLVKYGLNIWVCES